MPVVLLLLFGLALSVGGGLAFRVLRRGSGEARSGRKRAANAQPSATGGAGFPRPACWLAVKGHNVLAVQSALGLRNVKPCSWLEGLAGEEKLFIAPPVKGWILVMGAGLPEPSEDVDACFRLVVDLSRKLGQVQFFSASRILLHHAWVRADAGRVVRAYAWAGRTLWLQGRPTAAEKQLGLKCFDYTDPLPHSAFGEPDVLAANVDKVPRLASLWSLDPANIEERLLENERGLAGEPRRRY